MDNDPQYVDDPFDDDWNPNIKKKTMQPRSDLEKKILSAVQRTYYHSSNEKKLVLEITKGALSLQSGVVSNYPIEWIDNCCSWTARVRKDYVLKKPGGKFIALQGLISLINNKDRCKEFVTKWRHDNQYDNNNY